MKAWFTSPELANLPGLPGTVRGLRLRASKEQWTRRTRPGRGGAPEYHIDNLPAEARAELAARALGGAGQPAGGHQPSSSSRGPGPAGCATATLAMVRGGTPASARADARAEILKLFEVYLGDTGDPVVEASLAFAEIYNAGFQVSPTTRREVRSVGGPTIRRWRRAAAKDGIAALTPKHGRHRKGSGLIENDAEIRDLIVGLIAERPHVSAKHVMRALRATIETPGRAIPSYRTVQRFLTNWKAANEDTYLAHTDPDAWKGARRLAFGNAGTATRLNQVWEMDATPADVMCEDGRHALVGLIDVYSRRAMVLVTKTSRTEAILALLRRAMLAWGVPESVKTDQGKDYISAWMVRALAALDIRHDVCPPFTPESKPHIERFFGTLTRDLFEQLGGFIGHDVAGRKAIESRRSFAERFGGADPIACRATAAGLQEDCDRWVNGIYHLETHRGLKGSLKGKSPLEAAAAWAGPLTRIDNERALDVLLAEAPGTHGVRTVGKKGIAVENTWFIAPELAASAGRKVHVRFDAADMGRVYVFNAETSDFICEAVDPERLGLDRQAIAAHARERQKAIISAGKKALKATARAVKAHNIADEVLRRAGEDAARVAVFPRPGEAHDTPALTAAAAAVTPKDAAALSPEDEAAADALFDRLSGSDEDGDSVIVFPAPAASDRPDFADDADFARWVIDNPARATDADRKRLAEILQSPSYRLLLDIDDDTAAALIARG